MIKDINTIDPKLLEEDDRIAAYIKGQLSAEEEQLFLKELEDNPELKEKAIVTARLVKGLKQVGDEHEKDIRGVFLASSEQGVETVTKQITRQRAKTIPIRKVSAWIAVAASVVCIVWLGIDYTSYKHTTGLGEEYSDVFLSDISSGAIARGSNSHNEAQKKLEKLFASVKKGKKLDNTIHELSLCWERSTEENVNEYTEYSEVIGWNLAIAYLKDNNKKEAKNVLIKLIAATEEGNAINSKAIELLKKI